ncbi:hypothetical protein K1719_044905 [Acacia pycnantha]|nr:hypothetical protein K1719_044905 [Acacia pycnantha]
MHAHATKVGVSKDIIVASALLDALVKCQSLHEACKLFSEVKAYDTTLLNTMIIVYSTCGRIDDALDIFCQMVKLDLKLGKFSIASVISSCASTSSLELGEQVFSKAISIGLEFDRIISTSLVDFYCKCGFAEIGRKIFDGMIETDEVS